MPTMIRKLLWFVYSFLFYPKSISKKIFVPHLKLICLMMFFFVSFSNAANRYSVANGNWNSTATWSISSGGASGASVPVAGDVVYIEGHSIVVTANAACSSITFRGNANTLTVNTGIILTVATSGAIIHESSASSSRTVTLAGAGTINCSSITVGSNVNPNSAIGTTINSTISNLNVSGNLTLDSRRNSGNLCNATFNLQSGILDLDGQIISNNEHANNNSTFSNATGAQSGTLLLSAATPFSLSGTGTNTITLNGSNSIVNYDRAGNQTVYSTTYNNLTISGASGTKTLSTAITVTSNVTIGNGVTFATNNYNLTIGGNFTSTGTFTPGTGTVTLNGTDQSFNVPNFNNLTFSGSGMKTFASSGATSIANSLIINSGVTANLGTQTHNANILSLGGTQVLPGSWGSTSSPATYKNNTYFTATTGQINVSSSTCTSFSTVSPITSVKFNTLDNTTSASSTVSYESFPASTTTTTVSTGQYYALTVKGNTTGDRNGYYTAFFDWNGDGDFADAGEGPFQIGTINNSSGIDSKATSVYIQIPSTATGTNISMRIIGLVGSGTYNSTPCTVSTGIGQVEDYVITLQSGCSLPAGVSTLSTSTSVCPNIPFTLSLGSTFTDNTTYTWQTSPDGNAWTNATPAPTTFFNNDFTTAQSANTTVGNISLYGNDTSITGGELFLTQNNGSYLGGFLINATPGTNQNAFSASFDYKIYGGSGADGLSLSYAGNIANNAGGGESGEGSGIVLQLDTYDNEGVATGSRVRILYNGYSIFNSAINVPFNLRTSTARNVVMSVDSNGRLTVTIGGTVIVSKLTLPASYLTDDKSNWKFKFSARNGGSTDIHVIDNVRIQFLDVANSNATFTTSQTTKTYYRAVVTCGASSINSTPVFVDMTSAVITTQPTAPTAVCSGNGVRTISVTATGSSLAYSWRFNGNPITNGGAFSGATTNTLTITNPLAANAGNYSVVVTGACSSSVTSNAVALTVNALPTPTFTAQPGSPTCVGTDVTYTTQSGMTNYVWGFPGVLNTNYSIISGGSTNDNTVTLRYLTAGSKTVTINYTNGNGCTATAATSSNAITVNALPVITTQPQALALCEGQNGSFTVTTSASSPTYQWEYSNSASGPWTITNGAAGVSGHNTATLALTSVQLGYSGYYVRCTVTSATCNTISNVVMLTVNPLPTAPSAGTTTNETCTVQGSVVLSNLPAGSWTINQSGSSSRTISGSGNTYTVTGLAAGTYTFTVSNGTCTSTSTGSVVISDSTTATWNGTAWVGGVTPDNTKRIVITSAASQPFTANTTGCSLTINAGVNVVVPAGVTLTITNAVTTNGSLTFNNNSSLVQTTNAVNTGNITYLRNTQQVRRYDFTYWSSPVTATPAFTLANLSPATLGDKYYSFNSSSGWVINYNGTLPMEKGIGYIVRAPQTFDIVNSSIYTASFVGVPNNGDVTIPAASNSWNLIGNPYPSAIDANLLMSSNSNIGSLYFWMHNSPPNGSVVGDAKYNYTANDYAVFNATGGVTTSNPAQTPTGFIAAGQAFFSNTGVGTNITFTNNMRVSGNNSQFYKPATTNSIEKNRIWLNISNKEGAFKQTLLGYVGGATNNWDLQYDAITLDGNTYIDFYSINDNTSLTIQARALPFENTDVVPMGYKTTVAGEFTIAIDHTDGLFNDQAIYLEDKKNNAIHDLKASDYKFNTAAGTFADRFTLRYTNKNLGTGDFENAEYGLLISVKDKVIKATSSKENITEITVYDVTGKLLYNRKKIGAAEFSISNLLAADQVLVVKAALENNAQITRKIIFK